MSYIRFKPRRMLTSTKYHRNDLDFLRALAIIAVVGYHLQIPYFNNGYLGVDIFFVLSGFLMTCNIFSRLKDDRFKLSSFYLSRARRILPTYFAVLLSFLVFVYFFFDIKLYEYSVSAVSSSLFASNFYYYLLSGYFQPKSELNLLLHTWSLSLEVQFYFICPFIVILLYKCKKSLCEHMGWFLFIFVSIGCMLMFSTKDQALNFYMLPSRLWEFLSGGFMFAVGRTYKHTFSSRITHFIAVVLLFLIILFISGKIALDKFSWPSTETIPLTSMTCLIIFLYYQRSFPRFFLIKYIALRSYSIYLWHWPLIVLSKYFGSNSGILQTLLILLLTLVLSELSYRLLEKNTQRWSRDKLAVILTISILCTGLFAVILQKEKEPLTKPHSLRQFYLSYPRNDAAQQFGFEGSHLRYNEKFSQYATPTLDQVARDSENYLLIGDCYAAMFAGTIRQMAQEKRINLIQITADEVFPSKEAITKYKGPHELMTWVFDEFIPTSYQQINKIILMSNYSGYGKKQLQDLIESNNQYFSDLNIPIIYIGQTERYNIEVPVGIWLQNKYALDIQEQNDPIRKVVNRYMKSIIQEEKYIDIYLLPSVQQSDGSSTYIYDTEHLSVFGTNQFTTSLEQIF